MGKIIGSVSLLFGLICGYGSFNQSSAYFTKPNNREIDALNGVSAYAKLYEGSSPKSALEYIQNEMQKMGKDKRFKGFEGLEAVVQATGEKINQTNSLISSLAMEEIGNQIGSLASKNKRDGVNLGLGIYSAVFALAFLGLSIPGYMYGDDGERIGKKKF